MFDWNDLRVFLAAGHTLNLTDAALRLNMDATTVGRRIARLEADLKATLFVRSKRGLQLTADGARLLELAGQVETAIDNLDHVRTDGQIGGVVRLSASEGFGTWFLSPRIRAFAESYPDISVDLFANSGFLNPSRKEADLAILLAQPRKGPLKTRKLTDYALGLYAARPFLEQHGAIGQAADLRTCPLVAYIPDSIYAPELRYLHEIDGHLEPRLRSSSINAQQQMIAAGAGAGVLPCFMADQDARLMRILPAITIQRTFWLAVHEDVIHLPRVRACIDWLVQSSAAEQRLLLGS